MTTSFNTVNDLAKLPKEYLLSVKKVLDSDKGQRIKFGQTGTEMIRPNYQIKYKSGDVVAFNGASHKESSTHDKYEEEHLSREFTYDEVNKTLNLSVLGG